VKETRLPAGRDIMCDFLAAAEYRPDSPVWNFVRYKLTLCVPSAGALQGGHIDQYILRAELAEVRREGCQASADTVFSLWDTLTQAIALATLEATGSADQYYLDHAVLGGIKYETAAQCARFDGRWSKKDGLLGVRLLLDALEARLYTEIVGEFETLARLINRPGNMLLVPVIGNEPKITAKNLNLLRAQKQEDRDYFNRTLNRIMNGEYSDFFPDPQDANPQVAERFWMKRDTAGLPTAAAADAFISANSLRAFLNADGSVVELWDGSLTSNGLPRSLGACRQWIATARTIILLRDAALVRVADGAS
jgi:hypothetical protein